MVKHIDIPDAAYERNNEMDFIAGDVTVQNIPDVRDHVIPKLNQWNYDLSGSACTMVWPMIQTGRLLNIDFKPSEMLNLIQWCINNAWYVAGYGWGTDQGTNSMRKWHNETDPHRQIFYMKGFFSDPTFQEALRKWHILGFTYKWNKEYNDDYRSDLVLDGTDFPDPTYGHRPGGVMYMESGKIMVQDNYEWSKSNVYELKDIDALIKNGVFYQTFYLILPVQSITEDIEAVKRKKLMEKSLKTLLYTLSVCHDSCPSDVKPMIQSLANTLKPLTWKETLGMLPERKFAQALTYTLSFVRNYLPDAEVQKMISDLAMVLREKYRTE